MAEEIIAACKCGCGVGVGLMHTGGRAQVVRWLVDVVWLMRIVVSRAGRWCFRLVLRVGYEYEMWSGGDQAFDFVGKF